MKKRISRVLNFFAFNLLFFALYLNFVHKDNNAQEAAVQQPSHAIKGTVLVTDTKPYLNKAEDGQHTSTTASMQN